MDHIGIETNRHVRLSYRPAPLISRIFAWMADAVLYIIYIIVFMWAWGGVVPSEIIENLNAGWIQTLALMLPFFIYFPLVETLWNGRTVGKKLAGIRVTRIDGTRASLGSYLIRWLFRFFEITATGGVIAILTILINGKGQRLGDLVAGTCVIDEQQIRHSQKEIFRHTNPDHTIVFESAAELEDKEINIIRNLLNNQKVYSSQAYQKLLSRTRNAIEKKTGAVDESLPDLNYLKTIVRDYNAIYGSKKS